MAKMNRAQRRAQAKYSRYNKAIAKLSPSEAGRVAQMCQQGISPEDLERNYQIGFENGLKSASIPMIKSHYAATMIAAHEIYGFGAERCIRLTNRIHTLLAEMLTSEDMVNRAYEEVGVTFDWSDAFEPVQKIQKKV